MAIRLFTIVKFVLKFNSSFQFRSSTSMNQVQTDDAQRTQSERARFGNSLHRNVGKQINGRFATRCAI